MTLGALGELSALRASKYWVPSNLENFTTRVEQLLGELNAGLDFIDGRVETMNTVLGLMHHDHGEDIAADLAAVELEIALLSKCMVRLMDALHGSAHRVFMTSYGNAIVADGLAKLSR